MKSAPTLPNPLPPPRFRVGQTVIWSKVDPHDYGTIIGSTWTTETTCQAIGWHYQIRLHPNSPSYSFCQEDWAYEADIETFEQQP